MIRDELISMIASACSQLNESELMVLADVARGLTKGISNYGHLIPGDKRDFGKEAYEELRDGLVYLTVELLKRRRLYG